MKRRRVKRSSGDWCSLEEAIFGHTGLPVRPHHIRGHQTLPVQLGHTERADIHPFFRDPSDQTSPDMTHSLRFVFAGGLYDGFLLLLLFF